MKKSIGAYQLGNRIFIHAKKGTESVPAFSEPLYVLSIDDSLELIGEKVRECIDAYKPSIERFDRERWKTVNDPLIKQAGEKDSKSFFTRVKNPSIVLLGDVLHFSPRNNHGWKEGFKKTGHPNIELNYASATNEDLGKAFLKVFELSGFDNHIKKLLDVCRDKKSLGDSYTSIYKYLRDQGASEEEMKYIISRLENENKDVIENSKTKYTWYYLVLMGIIFSFIGTALLFQKLDTIFGYRDPRYGTSSGKLGKLLLNKFIVMEGTVFGYIIGLILLGIGLFHFYRLSKVANKSQQK